MLYMPPENLLYYHALEDQEIVMVRIEDKTKLCLAQTKIPLEGNENNIGNRVSSFIKTNQLEKDLFALTAPNRISIFQNINEANGFQFKVSVNTSENDPIADCQPYEDDKVITLCLSSMVIIHQYTNFSCTVLQYISLVKILPPNIQYLKVCLCSQDRYFTVVSADVKNGARDKLYLLEMDMNSMPTLVDVEEFEGEKDIGSLVVDLNMDVYSGDSPIIILFEMLNRGKVEFYKVVQSRLKKFDELDDVYEELLMMVKRRRGGGEFIGLDSQGNVYSSEWDQKQRGLHSPKKDRVTSSSSPQAKKYEGETLRLSFVPDMVGAAPNMGYSPSKTLYNNTEVTPSKFTPSAFYLNAQPTVSNYRIPQPDFDQSIQKPPNRFMSISNSSYGKNPNIYSNVQPIGQIFDSNVLQNPQESPYYSRTHHDFLEKETPQKYRRDPYLDGDYSNLVPMHFPRSPYRDWKHQPTKSPKRNQSNYDYTLRTVSDFQPNEPFAEALAEFDQSLNNPSMLPTNFKPERNFQPLKRAVENPYEVKTNFELCNDK